MSKFVQYRTFVTVVELGSFSAAAAHLHLSPSSVSKHLAKLEASLAVQLIDRSTQALTVTRQGQNFYSQCKTILHTIQAAEAQLRQDDQEPAGTISLSFAPIFLNTPLIEILQGFCQSYPDIHFNLQVTGDNVDLVDQSIDFAIRVGSLTDSQLVAIPLCRSQLIFCATPAYLSQHGPIAFEQLITDQHLIIPSYFPRGPLEGLMGIEKNTLQTGQAGLHSVTDIMALQAAVSASLGVGLTLDIAAFYGLQSGQLQRLFHDRELPARDIHLLYHKRHYMPENLRLFKDFIREEFPKSLGLHGG